MHLALRLPQIDFLGWLVSAWLALACELLEAQGGRIGPQAGDGQGCTVWFTLPAAR